MDFGFSTKLNVSSGFIIFICSCSFFIHVNMLRLASARAFSSCRLYCTNSGVQGKLAELVKENKIVLFMKGTPDQPMCGFSRAVVQILDVHEVDRQNLSTHNVLEDEDIRQGNVIWYLFVVNA